MRRAVFIILLIAAGGCGPSRSEEIADSLRRMREEGSAADVNNPKDTNPPPDADRPSRMQQYELEVARLGELLKQAESDGDPRGISSASNALGRAKQQLALEVERQQKLAELRARTPNRVIDPRTASKPALAAKSNSAEATDPLDASKPANTTKPLPPPPAAQRNLPDDSAPEAGPPDINITKTNTNETASRPASAPSSPDDALLQITRRIGWLADLRASAGDHGGAARLRQRASLWRAEYKNGNQQKALAELQKIAEEADR